MTAPIEVGPRQRKTGWLESEGPAAVAMRAFADSHVAVFGLGVLVVVMASAVLAPYISPQDPYDLMQLDIMNSRLAPGETGLDGTVFLLGTDDQGRDMLSGILYGLRSSLIVGVTSVLIALLLGSAVGLIAAYFGGWLDSIIMRIVDLQLSFPTILIALILLAVLGQGLDKIILALVIVQWAYYARIVRGTAMVERQKEYIEAAICLGLSYNRIAFRHIFPNCLSPLIVTATIQVAHAITLEATLSFLGVGLPVTRPSLGLLISNGFKYLLSGEYWMTLFPGIALFIAIVSINLVGDQLRDVFNPRSSQ